MAYFKSFQAKVKAAMDAFDLEGWLQQYAELSPGGQIDERRVAVCPKCDNSNNKLYVNLESKLWICHVCEWGKEQHDICQFMAGISDRPMQEIYRDILQAVKPAPSADFEDKLKSALQPAGPAAKPALTVVDIPGATDFSGIIGTQITEYLHYRGLTDAEIKLYGIRLAPMLRRFPGPFAVFPIVHNGLPVAWQGRRIGKIEPRYVSSDDIANWLWPMDSILLDRIRETQTVVIVEGVFDAAGFWRVGAPALCTFGKKISSNQIAVLRSLGVKRLFLAWDADASVTSAAKKARGAKHQHGETEATAVRILSQFDVSVVDLSSPPVFPGIDKVDPGEALRSPEVAGWLQSQLAAALDARSTQFLQWRLS